MGAAFATVLVILFINLSKILLVQFLFKIHPYSSKSLGVLFSMALIFFLVERLPTVLNPWWSIPLRSVLILGLFSIPLFIFRWSSDIETLLQNLRKRLF